MSRPKKLFPCDLSHRFTTSWLLPPMILGSIRLVFSTYIFTYLIYRIVYSAVTDGGKGARESFSYFTNITYWGLGFYFAFAGIHTVFYASQGHAPLKKWGRVLEILHGIFYSTVVTFPFLVTIVFWGILAADEPPFLTVFSGYSNVSGHLLNSVFALFELIFPRTKPLPWIHLPFLIFFLGGYLGIAYITKATQGFYTYGFLDPTTGNGKVAAYCFGILVAICIVFCVVKLLILGRKKLTEKVFHMYGKFAVGDPIEVNNEIRMEEGREMERQKEKKDKEEMKKQEGGG